MRDLLEQEGIRLKQWGPGNHRSTCPRCSPDRKKKREQCLSVTIDDDGKGAVWFCHHCNWQGGKGDKTFQRDGTPRRRRKEPPAPPREVPAEKPSDPLIEFFRKRGIGPETLKCFGITQFTQYYPQTKKKYVSAVFPYTVHGEIVNHKYRPLSQKLFVQDKGTRRTLFNIDGLLQHWKENAEDPDFVKEIIFCEGEMDVLTLHEAGFPNAVSLPDGAPADFSIDQKNDARYAALGDLDYADVLNDADRVVLAGDMDGPGRILRTELMSRFGKVRCWTVEWPKWVEGASDVQCKDANETLLEHGREAVRAAIEESIGVPLDGIGRVSDHISAVFDLYDGNYERPVSTGFGEFDEIYKVMPGTFNVVTGIPNHGKSNFVDNLAVNLARLHGWRFAVFSPEHTIPQHIRRMSEKVVEKPFELGPNERMSRRELADAVEKLDEHFAFIDAGDQIPTIDWILDRVRETKLRHGINGVIVDPYNEISARRDTGTREDEHIRDLIAQCKATCRSHGITMWMVAHPFKMPRDDKGKCPVPTLYDVSGASHWNNMADAGIVVYRNWDEGTTEVYIRKIREQGLYGEIGFRVFNFSTYRRIYTVVPDSGEGGRDPR